MPTKRTFGSKNSSRNPPFAQKHHQSVRTIILTLMTSSFFPLLSVAGPKLVGARLLRVTRAGVGAAEAVGPLFSRTTSGQRAESRRDEARPEVHILIGASCDAAACAMSGHANLGLTRICLPLCLAFLFCF